jgi:hypothetical protein
MFPENMVLSCKFSHPLILRRWLQFDVGHMIINRFRDALFSDKAIGFRIDGDIVENFGIRKSWEKEGAWGYTSGNLRSLLQIAN